MPRPTPITTGQERELVAAYKSGESRNALARRFGASRPFVTDCLKRHGIAVRGIKEACPGLPLRHDAFADAECDPAAAYWVGFLMADGCVSDTRRGSPHVILQLSERDSSHVVAFREFLGSGCAIRRIDAQAAGYRGAACVRFDAASSRLAADLARYGVVPRKSKTAEVKLLEMNPHFWRGLIDGNGSLGFRVRGPSVSGVLQLSGSERLVGQFLAFARTLCGTLARPHRDHGHWAAALQTRMAEAVVRALYENAPVALPRKAALAREILTRTARRAAA